MSERIRVLCQEPGFHRLFTRFRKKYESLGRIGGTVEIGDFTDEELSSIASFYAISPQLLKERLSLLSFEKQLQVTNLSGFSLKELLEVYFGEELVTNKEKKEMDQQQESNFFRECMDAYPTLSWWFQRMLDHQPDTRFIHDGYKKDKEMLKEHLLVVACAFGQLPKDGEYERLPLFAQRTTGNPHAFDLNQFQGKLLLHLLSYHQGEAIPYSSIEQKNELLLQYGILRDDLWSFVTCTGLTAFQNGEIHPVWQAAATKGTVLNVPLRELVELDCIRPAKGRHVWMIENSGVCSTVIDACPNQVIVCTHGQFKTATWMLMERLVESNCIIYYSGDFDPEGLRIAQRFKERYPNNVMFWRMNASSYLQAISQEMLGERIMGLENINAPELFETVEAMRKHNRTAYQEGIVEWLIQDIVANK